MPSIRPVQPIGRRVLALLSAGAAIAAAACSDSATPTDPTPVRETANSLSFTNSAGTTVQAALVVFNADTVAANAQTVGVTGTGIGAASADRAPLLARYAGSASLAAAGAGAGGGLGSRDPIMSDAAVMRRFRSYALRDLAPQASAVRAAYLRARSTGDFSAWRGAATTAASASRSTAGVSRSVGVSGAIRTAVTSTSTVGDTVLLNVRVPGGAKDDNVGTGDGQCDTPNLVKSRIAALSQHAAVVVDTRNPATGLTDAYYASVAATFDTLVWPTDTRNFGTPVDIDNNGRIILFYTRAVNGLTPANSSSYVGGFFYSRDLFPTTNQPGFQGCAGSNVGEMFYLLAPDPNGDINMNKRDTAFIRRTTIGTTAHEFQHLINAERRLYVLNTNNFDEDVWLNEGMSHIAEELTFYRSANLSPAGQPGQSPRTRLTASSIRSAGGLPALANYGFQNLARFSYYLQSTESYSPYTENDSLETRGATWSFLRYAADRAGGSDSAFFYPIVNSTRLGLDNLRAVVAAQGGSSASVPLATWFRDWSVANYADGLASSLSSQYMYPSWVFRSVLTGFTLTSGSLFNNGVYPLTTRSLVSGTAQSLRLGGGEVSYLVFSVPAGSSASFTFATGGSSLAASTIRVSLVQASGTSAGTVSTY